MNKSIINNKYICLLLAFLIITQQVTAQNSGSVWDNISLTGSGAKLAKKEGHGKWWIWPLVGIAVAGGVVATILLTDKDDTDVQVDPPVANDDNIVLDCHGNGTINNVLANDTGTEISLIDVIGGIAFEADGTVIFQDYLNFPNFANYVIQDSEGNIDTARINITVTPGANLVAINDQVATLYNTSVAINVLNNDTGSNISLSSEVSSQMGGTISQNQNSLVFTPALGYTGEDSFTYTITDDCGQSETATVTITINSAPIINAIDDEFTIECFTSTNIQVLNNDLGDGISISSVIPPAGVNINIGTGGLLNLSGITNENFNFDYVISNSFGVFDTATVYVTINLPELTLSLDSYSTEFNTNLVVSPLQNDVGDGLTIINWQSVPNGTLVSLPNSTFNFIPDNNFSGVTSFVYTAQDNCRQEASSTVTITIGDIQTAVATDDLLSLNCNQSGTINALINDTGIGLEIINATASNGTSVEIINGTSLSIANAGTQDFTITYTIQDDYGINDEGSVQVNVLTSALLTTNEAYNLSAGSNFSFSPLDNDTGAGLTLFSFTQPASGTVAAGFDNIMVYSPAPGFIGTVSFDYTVVDNCGQQATATVTLNVIQAGVLTANNDSFSVSCDGVLIANILDNDSGENIYITNLSGPPGVILLQNPDNSVSVSGFNSNNFSFTYTINDQFGQSATASVNVVVTTPLIQTQNDSYSVNVGGTIDISPLVNDTGSSIHLLNYTTPFPEGLVTNSGNDHLVFTATNQPGTVTFTYAIGDICGQLASGVITIQVLANEVIQANTDTYTAPCNSPITLFPLTNDTGNNIFISSVFSGDNNINLIINGDNSISVSGITNYSFEIDYTISNGTMQSSSTVMINVPTDPISAEAENVTTSYNTSVIISPLANDTGTGINITSLQQPINGGSFVQNGNTITFVPVAGFVGTAIGSYTITDACGQTASDLIEITVLPQNSPLVVGNDSFTLGCNPNELVYVFGNDSGYDFSITDIIAPAGVTITNNGNGFLGVQTTLNQSFSFNYVVTDGYGQSQTGTVNITIQGPPLQAIADVVNTPFNTPISISPLANDIGTGIFISNILTNVNGATLVQTASNTYTFNPATDQGGSFVFTYTITDSCDQSTSSTITVNVGNPPAINANNDIVNAGCNDAASINILSNDTGTNLTVSNVQAPIGIGTQIANGVLSITGIGTEDFTITYTITDQYGQVDNAVVTVNVNASNIVANDDNNAQLTTITGQGIAFNPMGNDLGAGIHIVSFSQPSGGTVSQNGDLLQFMPANDYEGTAIFTYTIEDNCGQQASATVAIIVVGCNFSFDVTVTNSTCGLDNGTATVTNLSPAGNYSIEWVDGQTGFTATGLPGSASLQVLVRDENTGCEKIETFIVGSNPLQLMGPATINSIYCTTPGSVIVPTLTTTGGNLIWSFTNEDGPLNGIVAAGQTIEITVFNPGAFSFSIYSETSGAECSQSFSGILGFYEDGLSVQVTLDQLPSSFEAFDGSVLATIVDPVGTTFTWNFMGEITVTTVPYLLLDSLGVGINYTGTVTNNFGCQGGYFFDFGPGAVNSAIGTSALHPIEFTIATERIEIPITMDPLMNEELNTSLELPALEPIETANGTVYVTPSFVNLVPAHNGSFSELSFTTNNNFEWQFGLMHYNGSVAYEHSNTTLLNYNGLTSKFEGRYLFGKKKWLFAGLGMTYNKLAIELPQSNYSYTNTSLGNYVKAGIKLPLNANISIETNARLGWHYNSNNAIRSAIDLRFYRRIK